MTESQLRLALIAKRKRDGLTYWAAVKQIGMSAPSTLHKIEHGGHFDYPTGVKILNWIKPSSVATGTITDVESAIFALDNLSEKARQRLAEMFAELYAVMRKQ